MRLPNRIRSTAVATLVALSTPLAFATVTSSSASISDIRLQVIDLTPQDGTAAAAAWSPYSSLIEADGRLETDPRYGPSQHIVSRTGDGAQADAVSTSVGNGSSAASRGSAGEVSAFALAPDAGGDGRNSYTWGWSDRSAYLQVEAHTAIALTMRATVSLSAADMETSSATALLRGGLRDLQGDFYGHPSGFYEYEWFAAGGGTASGNSQSVQSSRDFTLNYANNSDEAITLIMFDNVSVYATNRYTVPPPPAVPEPSSYALLGMGLCMLAVTRRRRA